MFVLVQVRSFKTEAVTRCANAGGVVGRDYH
jgi:hypothetical protein